MPEKSKPRYRVTYPDYDLDPRHPHDFKIRTRGFRTRKGAERFIERDRMELQVPRKLYTIGRIRKPERQGR